MLHYGDYSLVEMIPRSSSKTLKLFIPLLTTTMTDTNHPITPPPGLIEDWIELSRPSAVGYADPNELATLAARWGSDQELELRAVSGLASSTMTTTAIKKGYELRVVAPSLNHPVGSAT